MKAMTEYYDLRYEMTGAEGTKTAKRCRISGKGRVASCKDRCRELGYKVLSCKKLYPVCSWEENQHKLYNAHDRAVLADDWDAVERAEYAMSVFEANVIGGIVFATWEDRNKIMDYVWAYNARH